MEGSKTQYADNTASAGLIIRQKEPRNLRLPSIGSTPTSLRRSCSTYAAIFRPQTWTAPLINYASMVRWGVRLP
jgi:hypothetical protein